MIYCVEKESRSIYEARPIGDVIMIRPARRGSEHLLERVTMLDFNERFNIFLARFLIPDVLDDNDKYDTVY